MVRLRLSVFLLALWLVLFYLVQLWSPQLRLAPAADALLPVTAAAFLLIPRLRYVKYWLVPPALIVVLLALKLVTGAPLLGGAALPVTVTEAGALVLTTWLARQVSKCLTAFDEAVMHMTLGQPGERRARYDEVYREVSRARLHQRPLSVLALRYDPATASVALDRIVQEVQRATSQHYLLARVAQVLNDTLDDHDIVARRDDHFLVVLPEVPPEAVPEMVMRLRAAGLDGAGVSLQIGAACLPGDGTTLEGLVEKATEDMRADAEVAPWLRATIPSAPANNITGVPVRERNHHGTVDYQ